MLDTREQVRAALTIVKLVGQAIQEAGPDGMPSGILYASLMEQGITLGAYNQIIAVLKAAGLVTESFHVLTWVGGPAK